MKALLNCPTGSCVCLQYRGHNPEGPGCVSENAGKLGELSSNPQASLGLVWLGGWEDRFGLLVCQMLFAFSIFQSELR